VLHLINRRDVRLEKHLGSGSTQDVGAIDLRLMICSALRGTPGLWRPSECISVPGPGMGIQAEFPREFSIARMRPVYECVERKQAGVLLVTGFRVISASPPITPLHIG
jgi:hypothetical protein